jgi:hypothetical protein
LPAGAQAHQLGRTHLKTTLSPIKPAGKNIARTARIGLSIRPRNPLCKPSTARSSQRSWPPPVSIILAGAEAAARQIPDADFKWIHWPLDSAPGQPVMLCVRFVAARGAYTPAPQNTSRNRHQSKGR